MAQWLGYLDGYEMDGHPRSIGPDEIITDTVHAQGKTASDLEVDYVGSSTVKGPNGNSPTNEQKLIPVGARVQGGIVLINQ